MPSRILAILAFASLPLLVACGSDDEPADDAGVVDSGTDAGPIDASTPVDSGTDAGPTDPDADGDGVVASLDSDDADRTKCLDADGDTCDDCSSTTRDAANDGLDTDVDGLCDAGDPDDDNDGRPDATDSAPLNSSVCADSDGDTCEDCTSNTFDPTEDGQDFDEDGMCDAGDDDIDGDGRDNADDSNDFIATICGDTDGDNCDDCSTGTFDPDDDGTDEDGDGVCSVGDGDDHDLNVCGDSDDDDCDDCSAHGRDPAHDGIDADSNGQCERVFANCREIREADATAPSGFYRVESWNAASLAGSFVTRCDMTTDGGGWTLLAYGAGADIGSPMDTQTIGFDAATRTGAGHVDAVGISDEVTEVAIAWATSGTPTGDLSSYTAAIAYALPANTMDFAGSPNTGGFQCSNPAWNQVTTRCVHGSCGFPTTMYASTAPNGACYGRAFGLVAGPSGSSSCDWRVDATANTAIYLQHTPGTGTCAGVVPSPGGSASAITVSTASYWVR